MLHLTGQLYTTLVGAGCSENWLGAALSESASHIYAAADYITMAVSASVSRCQCWHQLATLWRSPAVAMFGPTKEHSLMVASFNCGHCMSVSQICVDPYTTSRQLADHKHQSQLLRISVFLMKRGAYMHCLGSGRASEANTFDVAIQTICEQLVSAFEQALNSGS